MLTGPDLGHGHAWPPDRSPFLFETGMPGVFAAGDVRHGSAKRVASAVGEGSVAIQLLHRLFAADRLEPSGRPKEPRPTAGRVARSLTSRRPSASAARFSISSGADILDVARHAPAMTPGVLEHPQAVAVELVRDGAAAPWLRGQRALEHVVHVLHIDVQEDRGPPTVAARGRRLRGSRRRA